VTGFGVVDFPISTSSKEAQAFFNQGMSLIHGEWNEEAERAFLQAALLDPEAVMPWWGRALANTDSPSRATWFAWQAWKRRHTVSARERMYIGALGRFYDLDVTGEPKTVLVDAESGRRRAIARPLTRRHRTRLARDLAATSLAFPEDLEAHALLLRHRYQHGLRGWADTRKRLDLIFAARPNHPARRHEALLTADRPGSEQPDGATCGPSAPGIAAMWHADGRVHARQGRHLAAARAFEAAARVDHAHMQRTGALPYELPTYVSNAVWRARSLIDARRFEDAVRVAVELISIPRHPRHVNGSVFLGEALLDEARAGLERFGPGSRYPREPALVALGPARWQPRPAPVFNLDRGQGGELSLADYVGEGRSVLVVFYLGAGCLHCVEQLRELAPRAGEFRKAEMPIVAVGTDDLQEAKAFIQLSMEADDRPIPFPILCDPNCESFGDYRCWSHFAGEALHGTFLIGPKGKLLWRDISIDPFMETDFLLDEGARLLGGKARR